MMKYEFRLEAEQIGLLIPRGDLVSAELRQFGAELRSLVINGRPRILVDLSGVGSMDPQFVIGLAEWRRTIMNNNYGDVVLFGASPQVQAVLNSAPQGRGLSHYATREKAARMLRPPTARRLGLERRR